MKSPETAIASTNSTTSSTSAHENIARQVRFDSVLYATDFSSASERALPYATMLAREYSARLYVAHAISSASEAHVPVQTRALADHVAKRFMTNLLNSALFNQISLEAIIQPGEPCDMLLSTIEQHKVDIIVLGTRDRGRITETLLGSVTEEMFHRATCPVLTVGPGDKNEVPPRFRIIIAAIDFGPESLRALDYGISLAEKFRATLLPVHIASLEHSADEKTRHELSQRLGTTITDRAPACEVRPVLEFGPAAATILTLAMQFGADLIVAGTQGTGPAIRVCRHFGSTVHRIVSEAHCPVLSVRT